jgi:hypothetical protein
VKINSILESITRLRALPARAFTLFLPAVGVGLTSTSALARSSGGHGHSQDQFAPVGLLIVASVVAAIIVVIPLLRVLEQKNDEWAEQRKKEREEWEKQEREKEERERRAREEEKRQAQKDCIYHELTKLRERIEQECPESVPGSALLRPEMLTEMVQRRITNMTGWSQIPLFLRERTDGQQFKRYREELFEIIETCLSQ